MKISLRLATAVTTTLLIFGLQGTAVAGSTGSGPNPFSDCGIGAAIFPNSNIGASISNVIWDIGTTAVTSATASPETCSGKNIETAQFILDTYDNLIEDTARGEGEHLATVLTLRGCSSANRDQTVAMIRQEAGRHISAAGYSSASNAEKASDLYDVVSRATSTFCAA
ncbi:MAG: DUF3015 family protein [Immundisolibacteraceae bacterium]|nr:DUF3015 family protein [Immundisolibacteraceae bacterium]